MSVSSDSLLCFLQTYRDCTRRPSLRWACGPRWWSGPGNRPIHAWNAASPATWCRRPRPTRAPWCGRWRCDIRCECTGNKSGSEQHLKNQCPGDLTDHQVRNVGNPILRHKIGVRLWSRAGRNCPPERSSRPLMQRDIYPSPPSLSAATTRRPSECLTRRTRSGSHRGLFICEGFTAISSALPAWLPPPPLPPELFTILTLLNRAGWPKHLAREGVRMFGCGIKTDRLHFVLMTSWVRQPEKQYLHDFFFFLPHPI